jgi:muramidase (phage lysozyme)
VKDPLPLVDALSTKNMRAFLHMIRVGEGTPDVDGYRRHFGGSLFDSFADHPRKAITAGLGKNKYTSTAAGAYQFLARTWDGLVAQYGFKDFGPTNQDIAAVALIEGRKALQDVLSGRFADAVRKCAREWASLPGSPYGQPVKTFAQAQQTYLDAGGALVPQDFEPLKEPNMAPFIAAALPALMQAAPALIRIFGNGERSEKNAQAAEAIAEIAKKATGETTVEGAVNAIQSDPQAAAQFREDVHVSMGDLIGLVEKVNALDQANIAAAREYNSGEPFFVDTPWLKMRFVQFLSIGFAAYSGWFAQKYWPDLTPELRGAIITLMVIAGWNGVKDYWMGSSSGSDRKTAELLKK